MPLGQFLAWESLLLSSSAALCFQDAAIKDENNIPLLDSLENEVEPSSPIYLAYLTWRGQFEDVIKSEWVRKHRLFQLCEVGAPTEIILPRLNLQNKQHGSDGQLVEGTAILRRNLVQNDAVDDDQLEDGDSFALLCVAISLYNLFLQENWTGPKSNHKTLIKDLFSFDSQISDDSLNENALLYLSRSGEPVYHLCSNPMLLFLANSILDLNQKYPGSSTDADFTMCKAVELSTLPIWQFRILLTGLRILDEPVPMPDNIVASFKEIVESEHLWWMSKPDEKHKDISHSSEQFNALVTTNLSKYMPEKQVNSIIYAFEDIASQNSLVLGHYHSLLSHQYPNSQKEANLCFVEAAKRSKLEYELTGRLGKKTKFQQDDKAQLVLLARRFPGSREQIGTDSLHSENKENQSANDIPQTLSLDDDTLLEKTAFTSVSYDNNDENVKSLLSLDVNDQPALEPLHQSILLSLSLHTSNNSPQNGLTSLQISSFVERVLMDARNWSIHSMGLLLRSRLESARSRTIQRGYFQLQSLVDQMDIGFTGKDKDGVATEVGATVCERLAYLHCIAAPSRWQLEKELAIRSTSLGLTRSALDIYKKLEMWEEVVKCLYGLQRVNEARTVINQLLSGDKEFEQDRNTRFKSQYSSTESNGDESSFKITPTMDPARQSKLWCIMGELEKYSPSEASEEPTDIKIDVQKVLQEHKNTSGNNDETIDEKEKAERRARVCYMKAWKASNETSAQAIRLLGSSYYASQQYEKAYDCFRKSVAINSVHFGAWFLMGCCAMLLENWHDAEDALTRCVVLEHDDGEVWNNLATVHLKLANYDSDLEEESDPDIDEEQILNSKKERQIMRKRTAFSCLKQAVKRSYENWKIWTNYMIVSVDVGELGETCNAMTRLVDLRWEKDGEACIDVDILDRLVAAVIQLESKELQDNENWTVNFRKSVDRLFENVILPRISTSPRIFLAQSRLLLSRGLIKLSLDAHLKAYRAGVANEDTSNWSKESFKTAATSVVDVVETLNNLGPRPAVTGSNDALAAPNYKFQARSILRSFMGKTKDQFEDTETWQNLKQELEDLK